MTLDDYNALINKNVPSIYSQYMEKYPNSPVVKYMSGAAPIPGGLSYIPPTAYAGLSSGQGSFSDMMNLQNSVLTPAQLQDYNSLNAARLASEQAQSEAAYNSSTLGTWGLPIMLGLMTGGMALAGAGAAGAGSAAAAGAGEAGGAIATPLTSTGLAAGAAAPAGVSLGAGEVAGGLGGALGASSSGAFGAGSMEAVDAAQLAAQGIGQGQLAGTLAQSYGMGTLGSNAMAAGAEMGMGSGTLSNLQSLANIYNTGSKGINAFNTLTGGTQQTGGKMDTTSLLGNLIGGALSGSQGSTAGMADPFASQRPQYQAQLQQMMQGGFSPQDPSYAWRFQQGQNAVNASAGARGLLGSGNRLAELTQYGQGMASQEYGNQFSRLSQLAGVGMGSPGTAAGIQGKYNQNQASGYGQLATLGIQGLSGLLGGGGSSGGGSIWDSITGLFSGGESTDSSGWGSLVGGIR